MRAFDRDALLYPELQIRDTNWLKGTLLCFPQVRRMVPMFYDPIDSAEVKAFTRVTGFRGEPLLANEYIDFDLGWPVKLAEQRLLQILEENL